MLGPQAPPMIDLMLIAITLVFFAISIAYLRACERL
jgi:hypothetical protein